MTSDSVFTLDYWEEKLTSVPCTLECPVMEIQTQNPSETVFRGPGHINIKSTTEIDFMMHATPTDEKKAMHLMRRARAHPYETLKQFVLEAKDYQNVKWSCGWTTVHLKGDEKIGWPLFGQLDSLVTMVEGDFVSNKSSVEIIYNPKFELPTDEQMITTVKVGDEEIERRWSDGRHQLQLLGTTLDFFYKPSNSSLWVTAETSNQVNHPYFENWISEPLRILMGQPIYPRLVARNLGNKKAHIWLRPSPQLKYPQRFYGLLNNDPFFVKKDFWKLYGDLLILIAQAKDEQGHPNFEEHPLTRFYHEILASTEGSAWIVSMVLSSVVEGIVRLLNPTEKNPKVTNYLKKLVEMDTIKDENEKAWTKVRNQVLHGHLVSPWANEEEDKQVKKLADLVRKLTLHYIQKELSKTQCNG